MLTLFQLISLYWSCFVEGGVMFYCLKVSSLKDFILLERLSYYFELWRSQFLVLLSQIFSGFMVVFFLKVVQVISYDDEGRWKSVFLLILGLVRGSLQKDLNCNRPSLVISSSQTNSSLRHSFLKSKLWFIQNLLLYFLLVQTFYYNFYPKIQESTHMLNFSSSSRTSNIFSLKILFSFIAKFNSRSFLSIKKTYFYSAILSEAFLRTIDWDCIFSQIQKLFLAAVSVFYPTLFFICYFILLTSCYFFLIQCRVCQFLLRSMVSIFLSQSFYFLLLDQRRLSLALRSAFSFQSLPRSWQIYQCVCCILR